MAARAVRRTEQEDYSHGQMRPVRSFECAIQKLAPTFPHCGVRIIGHGVEQEGADALTDRAP
ncbi:hypothetical protein [Ensifer sp. R-19]|uniref:hypothetical protein n=1 Tax=Ensifer sp. R-19 TaxID=3404055 RepID=UPI003CEA2E8F